MTPEYASKADPSADKLRGGYYTPEPIARFLAEWVAKAGPRLLEPSCGDGAILRELGETSNQVTGVELIPEEAAKARDALNGDGTVVAEDFFHWFTAGERGQWDGVAGNPPFIRFGNWPESHRTEAFALMESCGMKPTRLTNAWVPFVAAGVLALRQGGHLALVIPAELLQVGYSAQLRELLLEELDDIRLVTFRSLVFDGILQEVVLLLGRRGQEAPVIRTLELDDASQLASTDWSGVPAAPALRHDTEKWTKYFLTAEEIEALRWARADGGLVRLGTLVDVDVGVVTGRNSFFTMTPGEAAERGIAHHCIPLVARSAYLRGIEFGPRDLAGLTEDDQRSLLLHLVASEDYRDDDALTRYLQSGEEAGVHEGYKCRIRKKWWVVPSVASPDGFMLRQIHQFPLMAANSTSATSTDTVHRVRSRSPFPMRQVASAMLNPATFAFSEVVGRSYGGGILELEPREAEELLIPSPDLITHEDSLRADDAVRARDTDAILSYGRTLLERAGWSDEQIDLCQSGWERLQGRRSRRGRGKAAR